MLRYSLIALALISTCCVLGPDLGTVQDMSSLAWCFRTQALDYLRPRNGSQLCHCLSKPRLPHAYGEGTPTSRVHCEYQMTEYKFKKIKCSPK